MDSILESIYQKWGASKRKIMGMPPQPQSMAGKVLREGSTGAAIRGQSPDPLEVMLRDALLCARAHRLALNDHKLPYEANVVFQTHYVAYGSPNAKARRLNMSYKTYDHRLNLARTIVAGYLEPLLAEDDPQLAAS